MNIYLITTRFVYAVLLHRVLKSGATLHIMSPGPKRGAMFPLSPRELRPCTEMKRLTGDGVLNCNFRLSLRHGQPSKQLPSFCQI